MSSSPAHPRELMFDSPGLPSPEQCEFRRIVKLVPKSDGLHAMVHIPDASPGLRSEISILCDVGAIEHIVEVIRPEPQTSDPNVLGSKLSVWVGEQLPDDIADTLGFNPELRGDDQIFEISTFSLAEQEEGISLLSVFECWHYLETGGWSSVIQNGHFSYMQICECALADAEIADWFSRVQAFQFKTLFHNMQKKHDSSWHRMVRSRLEGLKLVVCASQVVTLRKVSQHTFELNEDKVQALQALDTHIDIPIHLDRRLRISHHMSICGYLRSLEEGCASDFWVFKDVSRVAGWRIFRVPVAAPFLRSSHVIQRLVTDYYLWHATEVGCSPADSLSRLSDPEGEVFSLSLFNKLKHARMVSPIRVAVSPTISSSSGGSAAVRSPEASRSILPAAKEGLLCHFKDRIALTLAFRKFLRAMVRFKQSREVMVVNSAGIWQQGLVDFKRSNLRANQMLVFSNGVYTEVALEKVFPLQRSAIGSHFKTNVNVQSHAGSMQALHVLTVLQHWWRLARRARLLFNCFSSLVTRDFLSATLQLRLQQKFGLTADFFDKVCSVDLVSDDQTELPIFKGSLSQRQAVRDSLYVVPDLRGAAQGNPGG